MTWQPIESAPRDGTRLLLLYPALNRPVQFGYWWDEVTIRNGVEERRRAEWWMEGGGFPLIGQPKPTPTHWMPIPESPEIEAQSAA